VVSGRRAAEGTQLAGEICALGTEAEFIQTDVRHEDEVRRLVDGTVARFGRLDVAVNNAGTEGKTGPITEQSPESKDQPAAEALFLANLSVSVVNAQTSINQ
jgi:NAD(P)-dependent dehydrogenase (short-subunit alcohol dehydrogenase family)